MDSRPPGLGPRVMEGPQSSGATPCAIVEVPSGRQGKPAPISIESASASYCRLDWDRSKTRLFLNLSGVGFSVNLIKFWVIYVHVCMYAY